MDNKTFWQIVKEKTIEAFKWLAKIFVAPGVALLVVGGVILLICLGFKNIQIGGLLGKLFGKKDPQNRAIDVANTVPKDRIDSNGKLISQGTPDSQGIIQAVIVPIKDPGLFSNPSTVTFTPPGETKAKEIALPDGVKAKDVHQVIIVQPDKFVVTVKDSSGVTPKHVDDLLKKYG